MKSSSWTKSIIFCIINSGIQKMDFKLVVCVQVKYRNQKIKDKEFEKVQFRRKYIIRGDI